MLIDLHAHSTGSDGTDSPAGLVAAARAAGLDAIALTDHDTTAGWAEAATAVREAAPGGQGGQSGQGGPVLVPGVEISCEREGRSIHLLGYLVDPAEPELAAELARARESRATRLERMVERLAADGIPVTYAAVLAQVPAGATPGRPHIADALVAAGAVRDRDEAFARWLRDDSPYYVHHYAPDPTRAVGLVLQAGGVPVLAHPFTRARGVPVLGEDVVAQLAAAGLAGLEADHPDHDEPTRARAHELARRLELLATGSSDYHGRGKTVRLAAHTTPAEVLAEIELRGTGSAVVRP